MKVGIVESLFQNNEALIKLATLPGRDVLLSQLLETLMSPSYGLVATLNGNLQKLIYILKASGPVGPMAQGEVSIHG